MALFVWTRNPGHKINRIFALNHLGLAGWALFLSFFREAKSESTAIILATIQNFFASSSVLPFFIFSVFFPYQRYRVPFIFKMLIGMSASIVVILAVWPGVWINGVILDSPNNDFTVNFFSHLYYLIYFYVLMGASIVNFIVKYINSSGFFRTQLLFLVPSFIIMITFAGFVAIFSSLISLRGGYLWLVPYLILPVHFFSLRLIFSRARA